MRNSIVTTLLLFVSIAAFGQPDMAPVPVDTLLPVGIFDILQSDGFMEISVKTDMTHLLENKKISNEYQNGKFMFKTDDKVSRTLPVRVKCRGRYRRMRCDFPPLKLKFKKNDLAAHELNEFNEIKLVTHCMNEREKSKELVLREYIAYKLCNILTPGSFRVQLVKVRYLNTKKKPKKIKGWGILIEDSDELAHRMGGSKYDKMGIPAECFNTEQEKIIALFNYMIGNTDWSCMMSRNVEFIKYSDTDIAVVPYDFDFAGLVNAPYAVANAGLGQQTIMDRVYLGEKATTVEMRPVFQHFIDNKNAILTTIDNNKLLKVESKDEMKAYLQSFFDIIGDEETAVKKLFPEKNEEGDK